MPELNLTGANKVTALHRVANHLDELHIKVEKIDFDRPWGGFFVVSDESIDAFLRCFFPGQTKASLAAGLPLTPKILVVEPHTRLSWQYHKRREEIWSVINGPIGIITSKTDTPDDVKTIEVDGVTSFGALVRHRLVGLETYGVVAEFWKHTDISNPSDEDDIIRVQDDFSRT